MHKRGAWAAGLIGAAIIEAGAVGTARGAEDPLLVVVEAQSRLGVDAADVRERIAGELHQAVLSPSDPAAGHASQVLIVALDENDIKMSMRSGGSAHVSRTIPDVADRAARLRAVGWLAGNLARDQVGPLLPQLALAPGPAAVPAATEARAAPAPATPAPTPTEPPPAGLPLAGTDAEVTASPGANHPAVAPRWSITASGGATLTDGCLQASSPAMFTCSNGLANSVSFGTSYHLEAQRQNSSDRMTLGAALDAGPDNHLLGLAGLIGTRRPWGRWYVEATLGAGVEAERVNVLTSTLISSTVEPGLSKSISVTEQVQPALYARVTGSIGIPINETFDFVTRLTAHFTSSGADHDFIGAGAGLRLKLP